MTEQELVQAILDYMTSWYKAIYTGSISVTINNPGYTLTLGIPSYMTPTTINCDYDNDTDFLNFIYKEIRERNYMRQYIYKVYRIPEH